MRKRAFICILVVILIIGFLFLSWFFIIRKPTYAKDYSVSPLSCSYQENVCSQISFDFSNQEKALNKAPPYSIQEFPDEGKTKIIFLNVKEVGAEFDYNDVINNPLIEKMNYYQEGKNFIVEIERKGAFLPAEITRQESVASIVLKEGDQNYPVISDQKPAENSAAYPAFRKINFEASLADPLKKAVILFQNKPVEFSQKEISPNEYMFEFEKNILKDEEYFVKAIITDEKDRTEVASWMFEGQIPVAVTLGQNRFKYLGWWGQVNTNGISVRKSPERSSEKLGIFSSLNRVKVLKEISGETVNDNNVWYEIDGGKYPHAYVFSEYITPIEQPSPPQKFTVPENVKEDEYWIDVDLTKKIITLFSYDNPIFSSYVSPGREENSTITGIFKIWYKIKKIRMQGGPPLHDYKYDLADVPSVLFYEDSYAIHGTYWHDKFGTLQSAGCTNLTQGDAAFIFDKVNPKFNPDEESVFSSKNNPGTVVNNHY